MKKIYIAGKVTGEDLAHCTMKFGQAQKDVEALGFEALNPLALVNDFKTPWQNAMKICLKALIDADAVLLLPDYHKSKGAMMENSIAEDLGIPVYYNLKELYISKFNDKPSF